MVKKKLDPADYIVPLNISGLQGRMLTLPATGKGKREILFIYGHHSTLERWWGLVEVFSSVGTVTAPDLPGFGGMDSFYKIGRAPSIDNMADYLAAFIKWRYRRKKKITIVGMSFGFVVVTRMLQRYPELVDKVDVLVSLVGFAHKDDFSFTPVRHRMYSIAARILSHKVPAFVFRYVALNPTVLRLAYARTNNARHKFADTLNREDFKRQMDIEIRLWHDNDVRTHMSTTHEFLWLDNCDCAVNLPVWHISTTNDHFFDHSVVEQHMRVIFSDYHEAVAKVSSHAPSVIADAVMAEPMVPKELRDALEAE